MITEARPTHVKRRLLVLEDNLEKLKIPQEDYHRRTENLIDRNLEFVEFHVLFQKLLMHSLFFPFSKAFNSGFPTLESKV